MKKYYFLGLAANKKEAWRHALTHGSKKDVLALKDFLREKYQGETMLTKNGRSSLALALKAYFDRGDKVLVNGFTCFAVYEAVKAAGLEPVFVDIRREDLNFDEKTLEEAMEKGVKGIIVQNSLGNPVDIEKIEKFAKENGLIIIEDLAHCVGIKYSDGRESGTVGVATALSFGKDKSIDTISGGAVIFRAPKKHEIKAPSLPPKKSDNFRARMYPVFGRMCRRLTRVHLGGVMMKFLLKTHQVERSADNGLDLERGIAKFEAKLALEQLKNLKSTGEPPIREFFLVNNRKEVLNKLKKAGFYFDGFWYEKPVSPVRYYKKVHFPEEKCPVAVEVSEKIINFPTHYKKSELKESYNIIKEYL